MDIECGRVEDPLIHNTSICQSQDLVDCLHDLLNSAALIKEERWFKVQHQ